MEGCTSKGLGWEASSSRIILKMFYLLSVLKNHNSIITKGDMLKFMVHDGVSRGTVSGKHTAGHRWRRAGLYLKIWMQRSCQRFESS